jgi:hypothetical protein
MYQFALFFCAVKFGVTFADTLQILTRVKRERPLKLIMKNVPQLILHFFKIVCYLSRYDILIQAPALHSYHHPDMTVRTTRHLRLNAMYLSPPAWNSCKRKISDIRTTKGRKHGEI